MKNIVVVELIAGKSPYRRLLLALGAVHSLPRDIYTLEEAIVYFRTSSNLETLAGIEFWDVFMDETVKLSGQKYDWLMALRRRFL